MAWILLDTGALLVLVTIWGVIASSLAVGSGAKVAVIARDMGIPVALIGCLMGSLSSALNATDPDQAYGATAVMLITAVYGGVLSAIGYFFCDEVPPAISVPKRPRAIIFGILVFLLLIGVMADSLVGLAMFVEPHVIIITAVTIVLAIVGKRPMSSETLPHALLFASLACVVIGLIFRFAGFIEEGLTVSMVGLIYGLVLYVCIYMGTHIITAQYDLRTSLFNWHWLEISGFLIFMYFAPETIRETLLVS
jgi:hypothetical protein